MIIKLSTDYAVTSGLDLVLVIGRESLREAVVGNPPSRFIPRYLHFSLDVTSIPPFISLALCE